MVIAVNTRSLIKNKLEGIGWFTYETLLRITRNHPEHQFFFLFDRKPDPEFIFSSNVTPVVLHPQARHPVLWYIWFEWSVYRFLKKVKPDVFLSTDGYISLKSKVTSIAVIHDINFYHYPQGIPPIVRKYYNHFFPKYAQKANMIVTVSEYSKNDISRSFKIPSEKIQVIYNGANVSFSPLNDIEKDETLSKYSSGKPYFVFVGALNPRKNVARLLAAFDLFCERFEKKFSLIIVGEKMFKTSDITDAYNSLKNKDSVIFTGRLQVDELRRVVGAAHAMVYVPYFEGFGIPLVEAMYCHVPIIASNRTSIPEVAGDAAYYCDPFSIDSIASAMLLVASDEKLRQGLIARSEKRKNLFSWDYTAEKLYNCICEILKIYEKK